MDTKYVTEDGEIMTGVFLRTGHNYDRDMVSDETGLDCTGDPGHTQQHFAEEVDINTIVRRFGLTGELPETNNMPISGDFTGITSFEEAMLQVRKANEAFMEFPAEIRAEFNNDPGRMIAFLEDPSNKDKAMKMGLLNKPAEKTRDVIQAIDEMASKLPQNTETK